MIRISKLFWRLYNKLGLLSVTLSHKLVLSWATQIELNESLTDYPSDIFSDIYHENLNQPRFKDSAVKCILFKCLMILKIKFSGGEYVSDDEKVFEDSLIDQKLTRRTGTILDSFRAIFGLHESYLDHMSYTINDFFACNNCFWYISITLGLK